MVNVVNVFLCFLGFGSYLLYPNINRVFFVSLLGFYVSLLKVTP